MKGILQYRFAVGKEHLFQTIILSIVGLALFLSLFFYYYTREPVADYLPYHPYPKEGHIFSSSIHHTLIFLLPPFSFLLGIPLGNRFLADDFQSGRFRMIAISGKGKKEFFRQSAFLGICTGLIVVFNLWLLLFLLMSPLWFIEEWPIVLQTCGTALFLSLLLYALAFYLAAILSLLFRNSLYGGGALFLLFIALWFIALNITNGEGILLEKAPFLIGWIPLGGWSHMARYPMEYSLFIPILGGAALLFGSRKLCGVVYDKAEA